MLLNGFVCAVCVHYQRQEFRCDAGIEPNPGEKPKRLEFAGCSFNSLPRKPVNSDLTSVPKFVNSSCMASSKGWALPKNMSSALNSFVFSTFDMGSWNWQ